MKTQTIVRFTQACETGPSVSKDIGRLTGLIDAENFCRLMNVLDVESNPRKPKESSVTREIFGTLNEIPDMFHFMSKGILISASECATLDRNRFRLDFSHNNYALPGIIDGGHNTFAIAKYLLSFALTDAEQKALKDWDSLVPSWKEHAQEIEDLFGAEKSDENNKLGLDFLVPVEVIFPRNPANIDTLIAWGESHRDITHARNNNVQLTDSTKDNHQGFYDYLKSALPQPLRDKIEWKTNDGGIIKAADVAALALIPLSKLPIEKTGVDINIVKIYNSKQYCVEVFRQVLEKQGNGKWSGQTYELTDAAIKSALDLVPEIVNLYDKIYQEFPAAYNATGGSFGKISGVRIYAKDHPKEKKFSTRPFATKFLALDSDYHYADGFIVPIVVGMRELMKIDAKTGKLSWETVPSQFLSKSFPKILGMYSSIIKFADWNPQKIGKDKGSYEIVSGAIKMALSS